jgi:hypothetical protein
VSEERQLLQNEANATRQLVEHLERKLANLGPDAWGHEPIEEISRLQARLERARDAYRGAIYDLEEWERLYSV